MTNRPNKIAFVDTETTGLTHLSRPWEIAVILREARCEAGQQIQEWGVTETEYLYQVEYTSRTLPEGTEPSALEVGRWRERAWGRGGEQYRARMADQCVLTAAGPEWTIARSLHRVLQGATIVGVGVHYDAEVLGRMFLRHGLDWHPWHYGIIDVKTAGWAFLRGMYRHGIAEPTTWDTIPVSSETVGQYFVDPPTDDERHTAVGDARWAKRWFDAL
jgi:hypothetical protein